MNIIISNYQIYVALMGREKEGDEESGKGS
jgi:hypothetical protein